MTDVCNAVAFQYDSCHSGLRAGIQIFLFTARYLPLVIEKNLHIGLNKKIYNKNFPDKQAFLSSFKHQLLTFSTTQPGQAGTKNILRFFALFYSLRN